MSELILHHYPPSPFSEKVRIALGIKGLAWHSVEIPRLPPRPLLFPMTGGYRRTPVLQAGADIYCDSNLILDELERRHPEPSLHPEGGRGLTLGLGCWLDGPVFESAAAVVLGTAADDLPQDFARDRVALYFGPDARLDDVVAALPDRLAQLQAQLGWLDDALPEGAPFFCGESPGQRDALAWYLCWFLAGRHPQGRAMVDQQPRLAAWYPRMEAIGNGRPASMAGEEALAIARAGDPLPAAGTAEGPEGLAAGQRVGVRPMTRGPDPEVEGELLAAGPERISLLRRDADLGTVAVHFPRVGYRLRALS